MTQVLFFHGAEDRIQAAAAWIVEAWAQKRPVTVFAPQPALAERLDRQLWLYPPTGFVPHCRANSPLAGETPVVITDRPLDRGPGVSLLNLSDEMPPDFERCDELVEIVSVDETVRNAARERVKHYKQQGCAVTYQEVARGI